MKIVVFIIALIYSLSDISVTFVEKTDPVGRIEMVTVSDLNELDLQVTLESENINDLKLTIYCVVPTTRFRHPLGMEDLKRSYDFKTEVSGEDLKKNLELFYQINSSTLKPHSENLGLHAILGYVLESEKSGILLEVAFYRSNETVLVNGVEVRDSQCLYDIVTAYASDDILELYEGMLTEGWQTEIAIDG